MSDKRRLHKLLALLLLGSAGPFVVAEEATSEPERGPVIYKTVDADGNTVFTDVPPTDKKRPVEEIKLREGTTYSTQSEADQKSAINPDAGDRELWIVDEETGADPLLADNEGEPPFAGYSSVRIAAPANDEAVRANSGSVTIRVALEPELHPHHVVQLRMDGQEVAKGSSLSYTLENVPRGTHEVTAIIVNANGAPMAASEKSVFHLLRAHR